MWGLSEISSASPDIPFSSDFQVPASSPYIWSIVFRKSSVHAVIWRLKAAVMESEPGVIARQRLGNHVSAAVNIGKD
jgi:hypothetical protein